jgi:hypothetical protein
MAGVGDSRPALWSALVCFGVVCSALRPLCTQYGVRSSIVENLRIEFPDLLRSAHTPPLASPWKKGRVCHSEPCLSSPILYIITTIIPSCCTLRVDIPLPLHSHSLFSRRPDRQDLLCCDWHSWSHRRSEKKKVLQCAFLFPPPHDISPSACRFPPNQLPPPLPRSSKTISPALVVEYFVFLPLWKHARGRERERKKGLLSLSLLALFPECPLFPPIIPSQCCITIERPIRPYRSCLCPPFPPPSPLIGDWHTRRPITVAYAAGRHPDSHD